MEYNPYIQRILVEQIQEFETLDLQNIDPNDPALDNKLVLIAYNIDTRKFFTFYYDLTSGSIVINYNSSLTRDYTVNTDALSTPRGFTFRTGWSLDNVVNALCNPPIPPVLSLTADKYLIEVNQPTNVVLSYTYVQNSGGAVDGSFPVTYSRGSINIPSNVDSLTANNVGNIEYGVTLRTISSPQYPQMMMNATDDVKVIYPFLIGAGASNTLVGIGSLDETQKQSLHDISGTHYMIANFDSLVPSAQPLPQNNYWFAVHQSYTPTEWIAVDASGNESALNRGPIATGFSDIGNLTFKGNSYKIWMGIQPTYYSTRIKIKF